MLGHLFDHGLVFRAAGGFIEVVVMGADDAQVGEAGLEVSGGFVRHTGLGAEEEEGEAAQHGILQVPIAVHFGEETLKTGVDIDDASLFERVDREGTLPTTSAPTPGDFFAAYQDVFAEGAEAATCFCVSSGVSGTYEAALTARELLAEHDITVVDTQSISMGQGFMALEAAEAARNGASKAAVIERAIAVRERTCLYAALSTLKYLAMSGRVGHPTGMASLLSIKPILTLRDGELDLLERVRTRRKA
jgi:DegV family protein with EDD domain